MVRRVRPRALPSGRLRHEGPSALGLSRREQGVCAALLVMIMVLAASGAWLTWRALQDQQVQLQGGSVAKSSGDHSLEADLTKREGSSVVKPPAAGSTGSTTRVERSERRREAPSVRTAAPTTIDGKVVAGVAALAMLAAGAGVSRLVLSRYRRRQAEEADSEREEEPSPFRVPREEESTSDVGVDVEVDVEPEVAEVTGVPESTEASAAAGPEAIEMTAGTENTQPTPLSLAGSRESDGESSRAESLLAEAPAAPGATRVVDAPTIPQQRPSTWDARQEAAADTGSSRRLDSPIVQESASFGAPTRDAASENIFDRRAARRVPYVQSAWLWWGDANGPVMVQDLSATGLRLRFPSSGTTRPPELGQSLRIFFPVSGTTVKANGRVQWKRTVDGAMETGLHFVDLAAADQGLIEAVLLAAD